MNGRAAVAITLALRFVLRSVLAGAGTARLILAGRPGHPGLVRTAIVPMSETGLALYGALVTLTPGSTVIDIDVARGEMTLHVLDTTQAEHEIALMRQEFEAPLARLFPPRTRP